MTKKSIDKREVLRTIEESVRDQVPRKEILDRLSEQYFDRGTLAMLIASIPDPKLKKRYKLVNNILLSLIGITILLKLYTGFSRLSPATAYLVPIITFLPALNIWFAIEVSKYRGYIYRITGLLAIAGILETITEISSYNVYGLIDIGIDLLITFLSFYLGKKMFTHYGLFSPKKDKAGNILLG